MVSKFTAQDFPPIRTLPGPICQTLRTDVSTMVFSPPAVRRALRSPHNGRDLLFANGKRQRSGSIDFHLRHRYFHCSADEEVACRFTPDSTFSSAFKPWLYSTSMNSNTTLLSGVVQKNRRQ